jgi:hypothetical protein
MNQAYCTDVHIFVPAPAGDSCDPTWYPYLFIVLDEFHSSPQWSHRVSEAIDRSLHRYELFSAPLDLSRGRALGLQHRWRPCDEAQGVVELLWRCFCLIAIRRRTDGHDEEIRRNLLRSSSGGSELHKAQSHPNSTFSRAHNLQYLAPHAGRCSTTQYSLGIRVCLSKPGWT